MRATLAAGIVSLAFLGFHLLFVIRFVAYFHQLYAELGRALPLPTRALVALGPLGVAILLGVMDLLMFTVMYSLARLHRFRAIFIPPAVTLTFFGVLAWALYLPLQNTVIDLAR